MRIPIYGRGEAGEPLRRVVRRAAVATGLSEELTALTMSHFLEGIVAEMCLGNAVGIMGFGLFAPVWYASKAYPGLVYPSPRFFAAKGLKNEVSDGMGPNIATERRSTNYKKTHCVCPERREGPSGQATTHSAMTKFRRDLYSRAEKMGIDLRHPGS